MRRTANLVFVVGCALLVGCSTSNSPETAGTPVATVDASPTPTTPPAVISSPSPAVTPTPTAAPSRFREAYANAFEDFWVAYAKADELGQPSSPLLSEHAVGSALAWARKQIDDHVKLGVAHRGIVHFRSVGAEHVTRRSALVGQCMDWSSWPVVNRTTGVTFQQFQLYSQLVSGQMIMTHGRWKLSTLNVQAAAC